MKYRYRDTSGSTFATLKRTHHVGKLGKLIYIKGYVYHGKYQTNHSAVLVRGEKGTARFANFAWGYSGTGPQGLVTFLRNLNIEEEQIKKVLNISWDGWNEVGEKWKITL
jgi:hypothetical protein